MIIGQHIVDEARQWVGTPFVHQGRVKGVGVDCVGLLICVARELDLLGDFVDTRSYPRDPNGALISELDRRLLRIPQGLALGGDVAVFAWASHIQHVGILTGEGTVIHAFGSGGSCTVESHLVGALARAYRRTYRFKQVVVQ